MNLKDTYNKIAKDWHKDHLEDDWWIEGTEQMISYLKPHALILDVGCGSGVKAKYLIDKGLDVIGIDISDKLLEIAKKDVPQAKFYVMDMNDVDKLEEKFDVIFAQASLLHILKKDVPNILKKLNSKLNPGGYFYIAVKQKKGIEEEIIKENDYGYEYERFFSYFTMEELKKYFEKLNLQIVRESINPTRNNHWIQIIGKKGMK